MRLTTATPVEIDTALSALYQGEFGLEAKVAGALLAIRRGLGHRATVTGRGASKREEWPTSADEAIAAMREQGDTLIGMMRPASSIVAKYDTAVAELRANRDTQAPMHAEFERRGGWNRFYYVPGGHVHRTMHCSTCNNGRERTRFEWLLDWSGRDQAEAIAALAASAHTLCSQSCCFPGAPVATAAPRKTTAERAADKAAAARTARTTDPKLIADTDGEPLRVDGDTIRTVRSAEIKGADALWWAAYARHTCADEPSAQRHEQSARTIAEALAHKRGTTPAAELAALVVKAVRKLKKDLGATEVAEPAAAVWAAQAETAAAEAEPAAPAETAGLLSPADIAAARRKYAGLTLDEPAAPLAEQPQPQHQGADDHADLAGEPEVVDAEGNLWLLYDAESLPPLYRAAEGHQGPALPLTTIAEMADLDGPEDEPAGARLDAAVAAVAADLDGPAVEALAIADAAGSVTITHPAGLLAMIQEYGAATGRAALRRTGREAETVWCETHDGPHFEDGDCRHPHFTDTRTRAGMNAADAGEGDRTLARIARALGLNLTEEETHGGFTAPRQGAGREPASFLDMDRPEDDDAPPA